MTRQRLHHGRGGRGPLSRWSVIPYGWDSVHQPVAEGTMTARVLIRHPGIAGTGWDGALQQTVVTQNPPHFDGWARVQHVAGQGARPITADDPEPLNDYLVTIRASADTVVEGDLVQVTCSGDPLLDAGTPLLVARIGVGSLRFERDLYCTFNPHPA